jgi:(1->4)-alpha-D-glucan 1-alpha-D-glucosylmutase
VKEFLRKAVREAKQNSSWLSPHEEYERSIEEFLDRILADEAFSTGLREFQKKLADCGVNNGLSQVLLKVASPGVPDFYQGSELWQLSLVDPDNRRPVDYQRRIGMLEDLKRRETIDRIALIRELSAHPASDEMKLFVTCKLLVARRGGKELFLRGDYIPLHARGACAEHVCAFARALPQENRWAIAIAPRWTSGGIDWADTELLPPASAPPEWQDALTGLIHSTWQVSELLREIPVALLLNT